MEQIDNKTFGRAIGFLVWFRNQYGTGSSDTFYQMADKYGQCNYGTCRNLIIQLVHAGYMIAGSPNTRGHRRFRINVEKYNQLVNAFGYEDAKQRACHDFICHRRIPTSRIDTNNGN